MKFGLLLLVALAAGCTTKANPASCADDHCNDPSRPFCDEDGSIGGKPDTCIAVECTAGAFETCRGDNALMCNAAGTNYDVVECMYGCSDAAGGCNACNTSDCEKHIIPKYLPTVCNQLSGKGPLTVDSSSSLDTSNALNCDSVVTQATGPEICIRRFSSITVAPNQVFTVTGTRVVALVADHAIKVEGTIDLSSSYGVVGPGGAFQVSGGGGVDPQGSGGAGNKTPGGNGGGAIDGAAGNGGSASLPPAASNELFGGSRGGGNGPTVVDTMSFQSGVGGGGGTLISCRASVAISGLVDAGGAGGRAGHGAIVNNELIFRAAGGGGAGGSLILQGMGVSVTGQVFANGGSGGGGGRGDPQTANQGSDGTRTTAPALGGLGQAGAGSGGVGGAASSIPGLGKGPSVADQPAGAGGGSAGFLMTFTPAGVTPTLTPVAVSPPFETSGTVATN